MSGPAPERRGTPTEDARQLVSEVWYATRLTTPQIVAKPFVLALADALDAALAREAALEEENWRLRRILDPHATRGGPADV